MSTAAPIAASITGTHRDAVGAVRLNEHVRHQHDEQQSLGRTEVDDIGTEEETLLAFEAHPASRTTLGHGEPPAEQLPGAAPWTAQQQGSPEQSRHP